MPESSPALPVNKWIQILLSAVVLTALFALVADTQGTWRTLTLLDGRWALLALLILTADRLLMSYKWLLLLAVRGYRMSVVDATTLYCSATLWGLALPTTVGADAIRMLLAQRRGIKATDALSSIVVERGIGFLVSLALALTALLVLERTWPAASHYRYILIVCGAALAAGAMLLVLSFSQHAFDVLRRLIPSRGRESRFVRRLEHLHEAYRSLGTEPSTMAAFTFLTFVEQLIPIPFTWAAARALGLDVSLLALLAAMPIALLAARLPVSFDGIGIFEGIFIAVMDHAGVRPAQSLAIAIVTRVLVLLTLLPWWIAYSLKAGSLRLGAPREAADSGARGSRR
jgi:uncharacterized protein (TIRG00374 family)